MLQYSKANKFLSVDNVFCSRCIISYFFKCFICFYIIRKTSSYLKLKSLSNTLNIDIVVPFLNFVLLRSLLCYIFVYICTYMYIYENVCMYIHMYICTYYICPQYVCYFWIDEYLHFVFLGTS